MWMQLVGRGNPDVRNRHGSPSNGGNAGRGPNETPPDCPAITLLKDSVALVFAPGDLSPYLGRDGFPEFRRLISDAPQRVVVAGPHPVLVEGCKVYRQDLEKLAARLRQN